MPKTSKRKQQGPKKSKTKMQRATLPQQIPGAPAFGPVSTISTAPVAIGNSIKGSKPIVTMSVDGCRVVGRDFGFAATATPATVSGWTLVGGMPITPSVLASSALKSYTQMYAKFRVNAIAAHYITSSATSQTGDVLFYVERDRSGPFIDWSNNSFLPYTLSDPHTVLGPQWTNHTAIFKPTTSFKYTDYGVNIDVNEDVCGQLCLFSKTSSASSPGYVILDYDITFKELQVNPRAGVLPVSRGQFNNINLQGSAIVAVQGSTAIAPTVDAGNTIANLPSAMPNGSQIGDIYRCIADVTNSQIVNAAWTNVTPSTLLRYELAGGNDVAATIDDGFTFYIEMISANTCRMFPTLTSAMAGTGAFTYGVTATVTFNLTCSISLVAQLNSQSQASY